MLIAFIYFVNLCYTSNNLGTGHTAHYLFAEIFRLYADIKILPYIISECEFHSDNTLKEYTTAAMIMICLL